MTALSQSEISLRYRQRAVLLRNFEYWRTFLLIEFGTNPDSQFEQNHNTQFLLPLILRLKRRLLIAEHLSTLLNLSCVFKPAGVILNSNSQLVLSSHWAWWPQLLHWVQVKVRQYSKLRSKTALCRYLKLISLQKETPECSINKTVIMLKLL